MKIRKATSGIQRKYLKYTIGLLLLALFLSSMGVWFYMRNIMMGIVTDKYTFMTEKTGISLDNLYQKTEKVTEECILNDQVQQSLKAKPMEEVDRISLSKYFAYIDLDHVSEYCYVDNKKNLYTRSYSKIPYQYFEDSLLVQQLGSSYADTRWFVMKDYLFGTGEEALFVGRKVHSLNYAHEPGYLFFKMNPEFLQSLLLEEDTLTQEAAIGIMDPQGRICAYWYPEGFTLSPEQEAVLADYAQTQGYGSLVENEKISGGILSVYKQEECGFSVFTLVPERVLGKEITKVFWVLLVIYLLVIAIAIVLSIYFSNKFTKPIKELNRAMTEFNGEDFSKLVHLNTKTELDQIGNAYNEMLSNIKELLDEIRTQQKELRTSELNMLIGQINPHFLYNTLDTIYMLARINKEETTMNMIQALSKYLRLSLSKGSEIVTVEDELENVKSYLQIQQIRNENLFTYTVDCEVDPKETWVLKLILQPLVENSIKYGFCEIYEGGQIRIHVYKQDGRLILTVYNSGIPIAEEMVEKINALNGRPLSEARKLFPKNAKNGYGVSNVLTRLRLKYGEEVLFTYRAEQDGTTCTIEIPGEGEQHEENL